MEKKGKVVEKHDNELVAAIAKAIAIANGHSHPDDYAAAVVNAYVEPGDVAEARREETIRRGEE